MRNDLLRQVELRAVDSLKPYAKNARVHSEAQLESLKQNIKAFGWTNPILVDGDSGILAGHGRLKVALMLGMTQVPVIELSGLSEAEKRTIIISDNQIAAEASWDMALLTAELADLQSLGMDLSLTGFSMDALGDIMGPKAGNTDPDDAPPVEEVAISRLQDVWLLGAHRLMCGDSTSADDVAKLMLGEKAALMNTDPPYGINYGDIANSRARAAVKRKGGDGKNYHTHDTKEILNDELDGKALQDFLEAIIRTALPHLIDKPAFYLWHPMLTQGTFFAAAAADILIHRQIIWVKPSLIMGRGDYHWRHELCFYGWIKGKHCAWLRGHDQHTIWEVGNERDGIHPTQKPVELFRRPILNHLHSGELCYEPFSGSGSQIIAAEELSRRCYAMELSPNYVDVGVRRWQAFTGQPAILEGDGRTFAEIEKARKT